MVKQSRVRADPVARSGRGACAGCLCGPSVATRAKRIEPCVSFLTRGECLSLALRRQSRRSARRVAPRRAAKAAGAGCRFVRDANETDTPVARRGLPARGFAVTRSKTNARRFTLLLRQANNSSGRVVFHRHFHPPPDALLRSARNQASVRLTWQFGAQTRMDACL